METAWKPTILGVPSKKRCSLSFQLVFPSFLFKGKKLEALGYPPLKFWGFKQFFACSPHTVARLFDGQILRWLFMFPITCVSAHRLCDATFHRWLSMDLTKHCSHRTLTSIAHPGSKSTNFGLNAARPEKGRVQPCSAPVTTCLPCGF